MEKKRRKNNRGRIGKYGIEGRGGCGGSLRQFDIFFLRLNFWVFVFFDFSWFGYRRFGEDLCLFENIFLFVFCLLRFIEYGFGIWIFELCEN